MGASLAPYIRHLPNRKALPLLFFMCDESWAVALADAQKRQAQTGINHAFNLSFYTGLVLLFT